MEGRSLLAEYFGDYPLVRILEFLVLARDKSYSAEDISKNSSISWIAFSEIWPNLIKKEIVIVTRKGGNARLYKLNMKNPWIKDLIRMYSTITKIEKEKASKKEGK